jgi:hypothetical protein
MLKLEGSWAFTLQTPSKPGGWPLSRVQYRFCMWPKGEAGSCDIKRP